MLVSAPAQTSSHRVDVRSWPTSSTSADPHYTVANAQTFFDTFVCDRNAAAEPYIVHSAFDEPAGIVLSAWGASYGIFTAERQSKGLRLPTCPSP